MLKGLKLYKKLTIIKNDFFLSEPKLKNINLQQHKIEKSYITLSIFITKITI